MPESLEQTDEDESVPVDPAAIDHAYRVHRARRRARVAYQKRRRRAGARFWGVVVILVAASVFLAVTTWREIGRLFGL